MGTFKCRLKSMFKLGRKQISLTNAECVNNVYRNRSEHVGLREPLHPDQQHRADLPRCGCSRGRRGSDPVHPRNRGPRVRDFRVHHRHDRRTHAKRVQVTRVQKSEWGRLATRFSGLPASLFLLAILFSALVFPVLADCTISFSPVGFDPQDLQIYNSTGDLIGIYNTTSSAIVFQNGSSYSVLVMPWSENMLGNNPSGWFDGFVQQIQNHSIALVILLFFLGIIIAALRRR